MAWGDSYRLGAVLHVGLLEGVSICKRPLMVGVSSQAFFERQVMVRLRTFWKGDALKKLFYENSNLRGRYGVFEIVWKL